MDKIEVGLREALEHAQGNLKGCKERKVKVPDPMNIRIIREKLGLSQREFAFRYGFNLASLKNWEQGARIPPDHTGNYLKVIYYNPEAVQQALAAA